MDIKTFIETTVDGIIEAAAGLQQKHGGSGAIINPPQYESAQKYDPKQHAAQQRVQMVEFDIALTVGSETAGGGGLKVAGVGGEGSHKRTSEGVSRVRFEMAVALPNGAEVPPRLSPPEFTSKTVV